MANPIRVFRAALLLSVLVPAVFAQAAATCGDYGETTPDWRFTNNGDGTITDKVTSLMWKRCAEGADWDSGTDSCAASGMSRVTWQGALAQVSAVNGATAGQQLGYSDWRLPNVKELASIAELNCLNPALNENIFPGVTSTQAGSDFLFWTASPDVRSSALKAWGVTFVDGAASSYDKSPVPGYAVRLVRDTTN